MSIDKLPSETRSISGMDSEQLIAVYEERWSQVHHLDDLDQRSIVLVVTAVTGVVVTSPSGFNLSPDLGLVLGLLAAIICIGGIYSTIRNRVSMEYSISAIDFIESVLNERQVGLFPYAGNYRAPTSLRDFSRRVLFSIRGPIVLFFAAALVSLILSVTVTIISTFTCNLQPNVVLSGVVSIVVVSLFVWWCLHDNYWKRGKSNFEMLNQNRTPPKSS